jgi:hypothetical protein
MPPNPRDNLRLGDEVPQRRVAEVIEDALRPLPLEARKKAALEIVERLDYFRLLAHDVEIRHCQPGHDRHVKPPWPHVGCILR